ncbi:hypothetical protein GF362_04105 [Candidatus Dojkabacteria bacterium]|nr:hypothetical protein [Candidatus Dojkabacteria bacterium]
MFIQSLNSIVPILEKLLSSNPNRSLSGIFKSLRKQPRIDLIGDYPLLSFIIRYGHSRTPQYLWNRNQVLRAVRISEFYKDEGRKQAYVSKEWNKFLKESND